MAISIDQNYVNQFHDNLHMLLEQRGSRLRSVFPVEMAKGEKHFFDRLGNFTATEVTNRLQPINLQDPAHSRRMATLGRFEASTYFDDLDKFKMMIDPTNEYAIKLANAQGKQYDTVILNALLGSAATGKDGAGSQAFDTANQQIAHGSAGLTLAKFDQALRILQAAEVDIGVEDVILITSAFGLEDMLGDTSNRVVSADFQNSKVLAGKGNPSYRGVIIVQSERIPDQTAGSVKRAILCTRDCLKVAMAHDIVMNMNEMPTLVGNPIKLETLMMYGAVRMEEARVVDILYQ